MTRFLTVFLSLASVALHLSASDIDCRAGQLHSLVSAPSGVTELRLTGTVDASDLLFIGEEMSSLRTLDLSATHIAAYQGKPLNGISTSPQHTIVQGAFAASPIKAVSLPNSGPIRIGDFAFAGSALQSITIPTNVVMLGQGAFSSCPELTTVKLSSATSGGYVFKSCHKLSTVDLGNTTTVGESDFADCTALTSVRNTASLTTIDRAAFDGCTALESFDFGKQLRTVGASAFHHTALKNADLRQASQLHSLGDWAFADNPELTSVSLPDGLDTIGKGAFFDCRRLENFTLPEACTTLPDYVLKDAFSLNTIDFAGLEKINGYALKGASGVGYLTLPENVDSIGDYAMEGMTGLSEIDATALGHVPTLGEKVWENVNTQDVVLKAPDDLIEPFKAAAQWQDFDIRGKSDINGVANPTTSSLRGRFDGYTLLIEAVGYNIAEVELYDASGMMLTKLKGDASDRISIDTTGMATTLYLVRCVLADGTTATLKLAR